MREASLAPVSWLGCRIMNRPTSRVCIEAWNGGLATLQIRAAALFAEGDHDAAFEVFRLALARTAGRSPELLMAIRYDRAIAYGLAGQPVKSKADLSRLLAIDPTYRDVQQRLSEFQAAAGEGGSAAGSGAPGAAG